MRKRYQKGSVQLVGGKWIAQWRDGGKKRKLVLGRKPRMGKSEAETKLAAIVAPINARAQEPTPEMAFGLFVNMVYLPFYRRKWKRSTAVSNEDRLGRHLVLEFSACKLGSFRRDELQDFLDRKQADGLSYSTVAHLRWDMRQIFRMAVNEGFIPRNPAEGIFIPRECPRPNTRDMRAEEVALLFRVLDLREQLIAKLAVLAGMRPGEIFALKWCRLEREYAEIQQRVYRGEFDTPKTFKSIRQAALADGLQVTIRLWRKMCGTPKPNQWVFPSEKLTTPLAKDNCWRRCFKPRLDAVGLGWVNFQVMRKTHSCLAEDEDVEPQVRADQMGHTVDVNQNVYTRASMAKRLAAVNRIEKAVQVM